MKIQKNIGSSSHIIEGDKPYGYSMGFWYIASITTADEGSESSAWVVATPSSYRRLTKEREVEIRRIDTLHTSIEAIPFKVMERFGSCNNTYYRSRMLRLSVQPRDDQSSIMQDIQRIVSRKMSAVVLIHGPPGSGKTMLSLILANQLNGIYCNNLRPWEPGESISSLYADSQPTESSPLIIAFDEIDGPLEDVHRGIPSHKNMRILVQNKQGWNQMLDEIQMGFYPHLILIMTTNRTPEFIRNLDDSYIREHRVDRIYAM